MSSEYVDVDTVAQAYGVDEETVRRWCRNGAIKGAFKAGHLWRIPSRYAQGDVPIEFPGHKDEEHDGRE